MYKKFKVIASEELPGWQHFFYTINAAWLTEFFFITAADEFQLKNPDLIINKGGRIIFIQCDHEVVGTAALVPEEQGEVQLAKMGVLKDFRNRGAGKILLQAAINQAKEMTNGVVYLETAPELIAAIRLYEQEGFERTGELHLHPLFGRSTFRMELMR